MLKAKKPEDRNHALAQLRAERDSRSLSGPPRRWSRRRPTARYASSLCRESRPAASSRYSVTTMPSPCLIGRPQPWFPRRREFAMIAAADIRAQRADSSWRATNICSLRSRLCSRRASIGAGRRRSPAVARASRASARRSRPSTALRLAPRELYTFGMRPGGAARIFQSLCRDQPTLGAYHATESGRARVGLSHSRSGGDELHSPFYMEFLKTIDFPFLRLRDGRRQRRNSPGSPSTARAGRATWSAPGVRLERLLPHARQAFDVARRL